MADGCRWSCPGRSLLLYNPLQQHVHRTDDPDLWHLLRNRPHRYSTTAHARLSGGRSVRVRVRQYLRYCGHFILDSVRRRTNHRRWSRRSDRIHRPQLYDCLR
uniref:(northern house mosquito) hypothetical protein n=1 Tax=Culex pipiens TaxID=7175 RepID=A0A8D8CLM3_CULPI